MGLGLYMKGWHQARPLHKIFEDPRYQKPHDGIKSNVLEADRIYDEQPFRGRYVLAVSGDISLCSKIWANQVQLIMKTDPCLNTAWDLTARTDPMACTHMDLSG